MQYSESIVECLKGVAQEHPESIDWQSVCEHVKDPRRKQGQRFSLTSILLLALAAILSNHLSELAIAQWGAGQSEEIKKALGFENGVTPIGADFRPRLPPFGAEQAVAGASVAPRFPEKAACRVVDSLDSVAIAADSHAPVVGSTILAARSATSPTPNEPDPND